MEKRIGIIMNGVTGRMGTNQHLVRSICAIRDEGGVVLPNGDRIIPDPILVGRNREKLTRLAKTYDVSAYSDDLDSVLSDEKYQLYFDAQVTPLRPKAVKKAIEAGKDIYCEKPSAGTTKEALELYHAAEKAGVKHGIVQDKLWLPGFRKLKYLIDTGFFGRIFAVRGEFGYWVFDGHQQPAQRPSWNYRVKDGGGIILDMFCHWRYVIDNLFGPVKRVSALGAIHIPSRVDEQGREYETTAEDAAYGTFELGNDVICHFNSSWEVRVRRDDLVTIQVDGTKGSAVAGLRECWIQSDAMTPKPIWNPDIESPINYYENWSKMPTRDAYPNAFRAQWELFLKHLVTDEPFPWNLLEGAKGVQLAELGLQSWKKRTWLDVPELS